MSAYVMFGIFRNEGGAKMLTGNDFDNPGQGRVFGGQDCSGKGFVHQY